MRAVGRGDLEVVEADKEVALEVGVLLDRISEVTEENFTEVMALEEEELGVYV